MGQVREDDANGHSHGPHHPDERIDSLFRFVRDRPHAEGGHQAENHRSEDGVEAEKDPEPDPPIGGVGDATRNEDDPVDDHVGSDHRAGHADEHPGHQRVSKEFILEKVHGSYP